MRALADFFEAVVKEGPLVAGYRLTGEPYGDHCDVAFMAPVQGLLKVNIFFLSWNVTGCCCGPAGGCLNVARSNGLSPAAPRGTAQLQVSALSAGIAMCVTSPFTNHWGDARTMGSCSPAVQAKSLAGSKQIEPSTGHGQRGGCQVGGAQHQGPHLLGLDRFHRQNHATAGPAAAARAVPVSSTRHLLTRINQNLYT